MVTKTLWREKSSVVYTAAWAMVLSPLLYLVIVLSVGSDVFSGLTKAFGRLDFNGMADALNVLTSIYAIPLLSLFFSLLYLYGLTVFARLQEEADHRSLMLVRAATIVPVCLSVLQLVLPFGWSVWTMMLSLLVFIVSNILAIIGFGQLRHSATFPDKGRAAAGLLRANSIWQLIAFGVVLLAAFIIFVSASSAHSYKGYENALAIAGVMTVLAVIVIVVVTIVCVCLFLSGWSMMHNARPVTAATAVEAGRVSIVRAPFGGLFAGYIALCVAMSVVWPYLYRWVWLWNDDFSHVEVGTMLAWVHNIVTAIGWGLLLFAFVNVMQRKPVYKQACVWTVSACAMNLLCVLFAILLNCLNGWTVTQNYIFHLLSILAIVLFLVGFGRMSAVAENRLVLLGSRTLMLLMGLYILAELSQIVIIASDYGSSVASFCNGLCTAISWMALYLVIAGYRYLLSGLYGGGDRQPVAPPFVASEASVSFASSVPPVSPVSPVLSASSVSPAQPVSASVDRIEDSLHGKSDAELDAVLDHPDGYHPDLIMAVCEEKERRMGKAEDSAPIVSHRPEDVQKTMTAGGGKSRTGLVVTICLLAVLLIGGALTYFLWYVPYAKDRDAERTYVYATNLFLRSEKLAGVEYNVTGKLPYGTELITYTRDAEWAEVKAGDKKGFVAAPYLMTRADFDLLDSAWGDMESREHIITTKCRLAIVDFYKRHSLTGGNNGWQVYSMGRDTKPNTVFYPRVYRKDSKYTDFFFIVHNNATGERLLAVYSFDDLTEELIFRTDAALSTHASMAAVVVNWKGNVQITFSDGSRLELPR